mmetsp:Transcript_107394/g.219107  ORF Transcript_107394/g.219107 Transcript_107394/m.219107 type:complete len:228 (+) Transcript_107394:832-1515(+)
MIAMHLCIAISDKDRLCTSVSSKNAGHRLHDQVGAFQAAAHSPDEEDHWVHAANAVSPFHFSTIDVAIELAAIDAVGDHPALALWHSILTHDFALEPAGHSKYLVGDKGCFCLPSFDLLVASSKAPTALGGMKGEGAGDVVSVLHLTQGLRCHPIMRHGNVEATNMILGLSERPHHVIAHGLHGLDHTAFRRHIDEVVVHSIMLLIASFASSATEDMHLVTFALKCC